MRRWEYRGRWALVTGASAGFGVCFARALAARGMNLVLTARRAERLETLAAQIAAAYGVQAHTIALDLAKPGAAPNLWEDATREREIHLLVNNAGFGIKQPFHSVPRESLVEMVQLNCTALLELAHLAVGPMRNRGEGGIINVGSLQSFQPVPSMATYGATKAFVLALSEAMWAENRGAGVRVLALCPGRSPTEFQQVAGSSDVSSYRPGVLPAEKVVASGLRALETGRSYVVPGFSNYVSTYASAVLPRAFLASMILRLNKLLV